MTEKESHSSSLRCSIGATEYRGIVACLSKTSGARKAGNRWIDRDRGGRCRVCRVCLVCLVCLEALESSKLRKKSLKMGSGTEMTFFAGGSASEIWMAAGVGGWSDGGGRGPLMVIEVDKRKGEETKCQNLPKYDRKGVQDKN